MRRNLCLQLPLLCLLLASCGGKKDSAKAEDTKARSCEENSDCDTGWVCLDAKCADSSGGAIYTNTENAVTPEKVKSQVEAIGDKAQKRVDDYLEE